MEEKYKPFDENTYIEIKEVLSTVTDSFDSKYANILWHWCTQIRGQKERQPCTCGSAAGHWRRCIDDIQKWINERNTTGE